MMNKKISNIIIIMIAIFLIIPSSYAIYKNIASSSKVIVTAEWDVDLNQNNINNYLSIVPEPNGTTASYALNITSQSEVDVIYSIVIRDLSDGVSVSLDNGQFIQEVNGIVTFADVSSILYSDAVKTKSHIVTFKADSTAQYVDDHEVNVNVIARQIITN